MQHSGDQEAGDDEEHVDADKAALRKAKQVICDDRSDGDGSQTLDIASRNMSGLGLVNM